MTSDTESYQDRFLIDISVVFKRPGTYEDPQPTVYENQLGIASVPLALLNQTPVYHGRKFHTIFLFA